MRLMHLKKLKQRFLKAWPDSLHILWHLPHRVEMHINALRHQMKLPLMSTRATSLAPQILQAKTHPTIRDLRRTIAGLARSEPGTGQKSRWSSRPGSTWIYRSSAVCSLPFLPSAVPQLAALGTGCAHAAKKIVSMPMMESGGELSMPGK